MGTGRTKARRNQKSTMGQIAVYSETVAMQEMICGFGWELWRREWDSNPR